MPNLSTDRVVTTDHVVTSQGPGTAIEFALELVARLQGNDKAAKVAKPMLPAQGCVVPVAHH